MRSKFQSGLAGVKSLSLLCCAAVLGELSKQRQEEGTKVGGKQEIIHSWMALKIHSCLERIQLGRKPGHAPSHGATAQITAIGDISRTPPARLLGRFRQGRLACKETASQGLKSPVHYHPQVCVFRTHLPHARCCSHAGTAPAPSELTSTLPSHKALCSITNPKASEIRSQPPPNSRKS